MAAYLEVHKNLCTLASWVQGMKQNLESAQMVTYSCLSTLSSLINMGNHYFIYGNTKFLATMAEHSSKGSHQVNDIAEATKRNSDAMKRLL
ncbi:hypothetical protein BDV19DRAFT_387103 [Aspergillus venezuelensis]